MLLVAETTHSKKPLMMLPEKVGKSGLRPFIEERVRVSDIRLALVPLDSLKFVSPAIVANELALARVGPLGEQWRWDWRTECISPIIDTQRKPRWKGYFVR